MYINKKRVAGEASARSEPTSNMLKSFLKFAGVGAITTVIQYLILIVLTEFGLTGPVIASTIGYLSSGILNYLLNYTYTFNSQEQHRLAAIKFAAVSSFGLGLNSSLMYIGVHVLGMHYLLCQVVATGVVLLWNFFANQKWTFNVISHSN